MALKKPKQQLIELATDPALDSTYEISAGVLWLDIGQSPAVLKERNAGNTAWVIVGASANSSPLGNWQDEFTSPTANQTTFTTTYTPINLQSVDMFINGLLQPRDQLVSLVGKVITVQTGIKTNWRVTFRYPRLD